MSHNGEPMVAVCLFGDAPQWMIDAWVAAWKKSGNTNDVVGLTHPLYPLKAEWPFPMVTVSEEVLPEWDAMPMAVSVKLATFNDGLKARAYEALGRPCWALDLDAVVVGRLDQDFGNTPVAMVRDFQDGKCRRWPEVTREMNGGVCYQNHRDIWKLYRAYWMLTLPRTTQRHCLGQYVWGLVLGNLGGTELSTDYNLQEGTPTAGTKIIHYHGIRREEMKGRSSEQRSAKVLLATPCYHAEVALNYFASVLWQVPKIVAAGIQVAFQFTVGDAVNRQRNVLAGHFLQSDCNFLLFVDSDTGFQGEDIVRMVRCHLPVMVVNYPKRDYFWQQAKSGTVAELRTSLLGSSVILQSPASSLASPTAVAYGGTGLMLIRRDVLEAMAAKKLVPRLANGQYRFFAFTVNEAGEDLGEDYSFCDLVRKAGFDVWLDPQAEASHMGWHLFEGKPHVTNTKIQNMEVSQL